MFSTNGTVRKRATRTDVARLANVSTAVVSYVLNNGPKNVAPETRQRVEEAARKLNYQPNSNAQALRSGSSRMLGVIVSDFSNTYFGEVNDAIENEAAKHGYSVLFVTSHSNEEKERDSVSKLLSRNVDAIIGEFPKSGTALTSSQRNGCPFILMDYARAVPGMKSVSSDFRQGVYMAATHLIKHHDQRNIVMMAGFGEDLADPRVQGWYQAFRDANLPIGRVIRTYFTREDAYQATIQLFKQREPPTALFCGSDLEAIGALRAIHEYGMRIPDDIAIVSFDGTVDTLYTWPPLSAIQQDTTSIAKHAVETALNPHAAPDLQLIPVKLVVRESCGCIAAD